MSEYKLSKISTRAPIDLDKKETKEQFVSLLSELDELQNLLFASHQKSLLVVLQGMDASGKDGLVNDVFTYMSPMGVQVKAFKAPTPEEYDHDFLWRIHSQTPGKGMIKIFNRSHYEDVLVPRVNKWITPKQVQARMKAINDFESLLQEHGNTVLLKFYLHISKEKQTERLAERMSDPRKMWKYNAKDAEVAKQWDDYMAAYEDLFMQCNQVPWHIVPADQNWYKNFYVAQEVKKAITQLKLKYPTIKA